MLVHSGVVKLKFLRGGFNGPLGFAGPSIKLSLTFVIDP